jgi:hypothetical protein
VLRVLPENVAGLLHRTGLKAKVRPR